MDTIGTEETVLIREVSLFQGLNYMLELRLGKEKLSLFLLERCPHFGGVLKEGFHCIMCWPCIAAVQV